MVVRRFSWTIFWLILQVNSADFQMSVEIEANSQDDIALETEQDDLEADIDTDEAFLFADNTPDGSRDKQVVPAVISTKPSVEEDLILASTLSGRLYALSRTTGQVKWFLDKGPVIKAPNVQISKGQATFLPDPSDGSLYMLGGPGRDSLKKLPFTVPELVSASPCRSSDGILYTGKKVDGWLAVDRDTGKVREFSTDDPTAGDDADGEEEGACPAERPGVMFIGRTEYTVSMHDSRAGRKRWNVTYSQYSAQEMPADVRDKHNMAILTTSSTGLVVSVNRDSGQRLWQTELESPVIGVFALFYNNLYSVPHTTVAMETLSMLTRGRLEASKLIPTLYIGECEAAGMYALPSLVDDSTVHVISGQSRLPLIEGPSTADAAGQSTGSYFKLHGDALSTRRLIGHHDVPRVTGSSELTPLRPSTTPNSSAADNGDAGSSPPSRSAGKGRPRRPHTYLPPAWTEQVGDEEATVEERGKTSNTGEEESILGVWLQRVPAGDWLLSTVMTSHDGQLSVVMTTLLAVLVFGLLYRMLFGVVGQLPSVPGTVSGGGSSGRSSSRGSSSQHVTAELEQLDAGIVRVGKIQFDPEQCIGKGCEGTFVFRGWFDSRDVAVKRLLPECFTFADREVELLRESDQHPNVIRYFCMEQDRQFRYIALELCVGTLQDYVQRRYQGPDIQPLHILQQATAGLAHLHALNIVHRDVKPHNVLLARRGACVAALISDFGLCKKLSGGRSSFSRQSGVAGTEGWIAPEMLDGQRRATCAVDVFSMGCVLFYVLSEGRHPFGDSFKRQYNILSGEHRLESVRDPLVTSLVRLMLSAAPDQRPDISSVLAHPVFWSPDSVLRFLQDVSDRTEREPADSDLLRRLERRGWEVTGGDWRQLIDDVVLEDLGKFRSYRGSSIRDLLRAVRNKRNHYRSLPERARDLLGETAGQYCQYWLRYRFPRLLVHTWTAVQPLVRLEPAFERYYGTDYCWTLEPDVNAVPPWRQKKDSGGSSLSTSAADGSDQQLPAAAAHLHPGISLTDALRETDSRPRTCDTRTVTGSDWADVGAQVRQRLVDIVQQGGVVVPDAEQLIGRPVTAPAHVDQ